MSNEKFITFTDLYTMNYELTDIYAERQKWCDGALFRRERPRKSNGIIFLNGCSGEYTNRQGETFFAPCKSLVCLPHKSEYTILNVSSKIDSPDAYLVEFNIVQNNKNITFSDSPFLIKGMNQYYVNELAENIVKEYETLIKSPPALKALIYKLLAYLGKEALTSYDKKHLLISPAIDFMEKNPVNSLSVEQLANMCHVSSGCFRKLFREYAGKSPIQYIIDRKIKMAKKMLENSNTSIERIAELLEFESSAYFCKLFKKKTKMTPTEYRNSN